MVVFGFPGEDAPCRAKLSSSCCVAALEITFKEAL